MWEVDPITGRPAPSEALCWHAAVSCKGPDATGTFEACTPTSAPLTPVTEYLAFLDALRDATNKTIILVGAVGIPPVTEHNVDSPFEPTAGGMHAVEVRQWRDTDLTLPDLAAGRTTVDKQFELGVGPACTGLTDGGDVVGQAIPSLRILEVCRGLDASNEGGFPRVRCCMESICDEDLTPALYCLDALIPPIFGE